jgi:hypothetical protein
VWIADPSAIMPEFNMAKIRGRKRPLPYLIPRLRKILERHLASGQVWQSHLVLVAHTPTHTHPDRPFPCTPFPLLCLSTRGKIVQFGGNSGGGAMALFWC